MVFDILPGVWLVGSAVQLIKQSTTYLLNIDVFAAQPFIVGSCYPRGVENRYSVSYTVLEFQSVANYAKNRDPYGVFGTSRSQTDKMGHSIRQVRGCLSSELDGLRKQNRLVA